MTAAKIAPKTSRPLRIGFDLDGVILYNPARIVRPLIAHFKRLVLHKRHLKFYVPQSPVEQWLFRLFHKSSIFITPGMNEVEQLFRDRRIVTYLITARYSFLEEDLNRWLNKMQSPRYFSAHYYNRLNEQPHVYKARKLKELDLDIFIEDNWDIVQYLSREQQAGRLRTTAYWIYNIFDRHIPYPYKFPYLQKAMHYIVEHHLPRV